jgi:uncharacterized damage-inducible protein DinB
MKQTSLLAERFREVLLSGKWIATTNLKEQLENISFDQATKKIGSHNSIAALTFHIHYYVAGILNVLQGGSLDIKDQYSFDQPPLQTDADWQKLKDKVFSDCETFASLLDELSDEKLSENFSDGKYGTIQKNIDAIIDHSFYHLGQIVLLKKLI